MTSSSWRMSRMMKLSAAMSEAERVPMLELWTIYDHPRDFPGAFVARLWLMDQPTDRVLISSTLDGVRALLPPGLMRLVRDLDDDPCVVESWL